MLYKHSRRTVQAQRIEKVSFDNSEHSWGSAGTLGEVVKFPGEGLVEVCPAPLKTQNIKQVSLETQNIFARSC